jgi:hypothetical protein
MFKNQKASCFLPLFHSLSIPSETTSQKDMPLNLLCSNEISSLFNTFITQTNYQILFCSLHDIQLPFGAGGRAKNKKSKKVFLLPVNAFAECNGVLGHNAFYEMTKLIIFFGFF